MIYKSFMLVHVKNCSRPQTTTKVQDTTTFYVVEIVGLYYEYLAIIDTFPS
jgi:hypothetical protein